MENKSVWHYQDELPENGRKIQMVLDVKKPTEVDTWNNRLTVSKFSWKQVKLWRYLDE